MMGFFDRLCFTPEIQNGALALMQVLRILKAQNQ